MLPGAASPGGKYGLKTLVAFMVLALVNPLQEVQPSPAATLAVCQHSRPSPSRLVGGITPPSAL